MADEALHQIQLSGKHLVALFIAATTVAVVIFLCGVMVGRGIRANTAAAHGDVAAQPPIDPTAAARPQAPSADAPAPTPEKLSYPDRLANQAQAPEALKEPVMEPKAAASSPARPSPRRPDPVPVQTASEPTGEGFAVQVAAVAERGEATMIASRLTRKGYPAYVMSPAAGAPRVYRVRVGKFRDRREAESVAVRLEKEEQFKPWITR